MVSLGPYSGSSNPPVPRAPRAPTLLVVVATLGLIAVFVLLALTFYGNAEKQVVSQHSQQQLLLAKTASVAIEARLTEFRYVVAHWAADLGRNALSPASLLALGEEVNSQPFRAVFLLDPDCQTILVRGTLPPASQEQLCEVAKSAAGGVSEAIPTAEGFVVAVVEPIPAQGRQRGQLGALLPVHFLLAHALKPIQSSPSAHVAILDQSGLLIENTRHPEMVGRRIPAELGECGTCHPSFEPERQMIEGHEGSVQLQIGSEPKGLVAFAPVEVANRRWAIAVSVPYSQIVEQTRRSFGQILMLVGLFIGVVVASAVALIRFHQKRVAAEQKALQIERRQQFEQQLLHAEQLATVGKMTSHIAHEINTPLASIGLNVSYLRNELERRLGSKVPEIEEVTEAITSEINRLKKVIGDYLRFSRLHRPMPKPCLLEEIVQDFVLFISKEAHERQIEIKSQIAPLGRPLWVDENLIRQALLNIVRNSFEAMAEGGQLEISLRPSRNFADLRIADNGPGIPPEQLPRVFDPFFTTKAEGTGLGLAQTRKIIHEHEGEILCQSEVNRGTTFLIRLPLQKAVSPEIEPQPEISKVEESRYAYKK